MKKIFAFILATIMVLSLVPASVFAAFTKCPDTHTSTNCDCTLVETVVPTCQNNGYQTYICNTCGEQFVDNLKSKSDHVWISNTKKSAGNIAASCVYQTNGVEYLICAKCDTEWTKTVDWNSTSVHNLTFVSGVGCEKLYACSLCGAEGYLALNKDGDTVLSDEVAHSYEFTKVETEPEWKNGKSYEGYAIYTCEECNVIKKVVIEAPDCTHPADYDDWTIAQAAKNATCAAKGAYLVIKCPDCSYYMYCTSQTCATDHVDGGHTFVELADSDDDGNYVEHASISALGHYDASGNKNGGSGTCGSTYYCVVCNTWQARGHNYGSWTVLVEANCTTAGQRWRQCKDCFTINTGSITKLGHSNKTVTLAATCATPAVTFEVCTRSNCPLAPTLINGQPYKVTNTPSYVGNVNSNAHNFVVDSENNLDNTTGNDLYCSNASYVYRVCANGCAEYGSGKLELVQPKLHELYAYKTSHNYTTATSSMAAFTTRSYYACKNCNYVSTKGVDVLDTAVKTSFSTVYEALEYHGLISTYWKLNEKGEVVVDYYAGRGSYEGLTADAIATAVFEAQPYLSTPATCTTPATTVYKCKDCNSYVWVQGEKAAHTPSTFTAGKDSTCTTLGVYDTYVCLVCGQTYWYDSELKQHTTSPIKNTCVNTVVPKTDSCADGTVYYECKLCGTCYTDATCSTKYVPAGHSYVTLLAGVAATCNTTGLPEIRYCSECGALEVNVIYMVAGEEVRVNFNDAAVPAVYKKSAFAETITTTYLSAAVTVNVSANGTVTFIYEGDTWTEWPTAVNVKKMDNTKSHIAPYVTATNTLATGVVAESSITMKSAITTTVQSNDENDHTKASFILNYCEACEYEFIDNYVAAVGGHMNSKGSILTTECNNEGVLGDRICVACYNYYYSIAVKEGLTVEEFQIKYSSYYTIEVAHVWSDTTDSNATCKTDGYSYKYCLKCGYYDISDEIVKANATTFHKSLVAGTNTKYTATVVGPRADYAHDGSYYLACPVCSAKLTNLTESKCPGTGLEIYLSTDSDSYIPGSTVYVTVTLDSYYGVKVWGLNFPVVFDPEVFKFEGYSFNTASGDFQTFAANEVSGGYSAQFMPAFGGYITDGTYEDSGIISIVANADDEVVIKGEQTLVTLAFSVISTEAVDSTSFAVAEKTILSGGTLGKQLKEIDATTEGTFWGNYYMLTSAPSYKTYTVDVVNGNGKTVKTNYNGSNTSDAVEVTAFLDLDGKAGLTMSDAYELYYLIYNNEYDVKADADFDGYVTAKDLSILYSILTGYTTVETIIAPSVELPEGWYAGLGGR